MFLAPRIKSPVSTGFGIAFGVFPTCKYQFLFGGSNRLSVILDPSDPCSALLSTFLPRLESLFLFLVKGFNSNPGLIQPIYLVCVFVISFSPMTSVFQS